MAGVIFLLPALCVAQTNTFPSSGNVGIGTTTPNSSDALQIVGTTGSTPNVNLLGFNPALIITNSSNTLGDSPDIALQSSRGTPAIPTATQSGDNIGQLAAAGYTGSAFPGSKVKIGFIATETWTPTANGTAISFQTTSNTDTTVTRTERMRIDNTGNVGIGTTNPQYPLSVNGTIQAKKSS
jgi:hypothetical protein